MHKIQIVNKPGSKEHMEEKSTFEKKHKPGYTMFRKTSRLVNKSSTVYGGDDDQDSDSGG